MTEYVSITGGGSPVDFENAVLKGKADDHGLFVPTNLPEITTDQLKAWQKHSYPDLAFEILRLNIEESIIPSVDLKRLVTESFSSFYEAEIIPHYSSKKYQNIIVQELFHGPTLSFKDVAMGFVVNLFNYFLERRKEHMTIMVATSGDTGPAAAFASINKKQLDTWLLYPEGLVTEEQRRQMTTINEDNVHTLAIDNCKNGSDDLDDLINSCFADKGFHDEVNLSSVNSINWARVMMQTAHYFYGYLRNVAVVGEPICFSVPCGAFGNLCAGYLAKRMGLPVEKFIANSNENQVLSEVFTTGKLTKKDIITTHSSAIDIAAPMNFWRFLYFSLGEDSALIKALYEQYEKDGEIQFTEDLFSKLREGFLSYTVSDEETLSIISKFYTEEAYLLDPHGAVAVAGGLHYSEQLKAFPIVCLATAHPAKFPDIIHLATGETPIAATHASIASAKTLPERALDFTYQNMFSAVPATIRDHHHTKS
jgi:threonine synthase